MRFLLLGFVLVANVYSETPTVTTNTQTTKPAPITAITDEDLKTVEDVPFAPPQSRNSNVDIGQGRNKCRTFAGHGVSNAGVKATALVDFTLLYSSPTYDSFQRLTDYKQINELNTETLKEDVALEHDAVVKMRCRGVRLAMFQETTTSTPVPVKEYYARCNNGYFYACKFDDKMHDAGMDRYYVKYNGGAKKCLTSSKTPAFTCRPGCDVTRYVDSTKYTIPASAGKIYDLKDPIGYNFDGTVVEIVYKQLMPTDSITVECANGTFLATSTTGQEKSFQMSCDNNGAVSFPDDNDMTKNSSCTDKKACTVPDDADEKVVKHPQKDEMITYLQQRWGVYRNGSFVRPSNSIQDNAYILVKCGADNRKDERSILCVNGNYFPSVKNACMANLYKEEDSDLE